MKKKSVLRLPFVIGFVVGLGMSAAMPAYAEPVTPVHELAEKAWPYMNSDQRKLVEIMAKDYYVNGTTPDQKRRISGAANGRYESLPEWKKAPYRGAAIRQLGHTAEDFMRGSV
ncbi:hypothetical protein [Parvularcula sp. LCG005]|uniref:hypothetical protein n=1 Tax=Parvularcula sp. LCG005 TaxID=3078805 RepID=UPI002942BA8E|nr:hypothetical protein [Parvularcula sp. LCG005]WOI54214.1 hypothetical protein RUI03_04255 [Parvularcula sp. LCG005]